MSVSARNSSAIVRPELIIFDCDGVLVDSELLSLSILRDLITASGVAMQLETVQERFQGRSLASTVQEVQTQYQVVISEKELTELNTRLFARFKTSLLPISGVREFIDMLTLPFCVASSSSLERVRYSLELTGLLSAFSQRIFSSTMVTFGKPAPDLFLHTAKVMGVLPSKCIVIEDSVAGVQAAQRAGMASIGLTAGSHAKGAGYKDALIKHGASIVCDDYHELSQFLKRIDL